MTRRRDTVSGPGQPTSTAAPSAANSSGTSSLEQTPASPGTHSLGQMTREKTRQALMRTGKNRVNQSSDYSRVWKQHRSGLGGKRVALAVTSGAAEASKVATGSSEVLGGLETAGGLEAGLEAAVAGVGLR